LQAPKNMVMIRITANSVKVVFLAIGKPLSINKFIC
jgi:hypothetical protein